MKEPEIRPRLPWLNLVTMAVIGMAVIGLYQVSASLNQTVPWGTVRCAVALGLASFLIFRWQQSYFWGLVAGLLVPLHPLFTGCGEPFKDGMVALVFEVIVLMVLTAAWSLTFLPRFAWRSWCFAALLLCVLLTLAWPLGIRVALIVSGFTLLGLLLAAFLAVQRRRSNPKTGPSWLNIAIAFLLGLGVPVAGLFLAPFTDRIPNWHRNPEVKDAQSALDFLQAAGGVTMTDYHVQGFRGEELAQWAWPEAAVVLPLMAWGFWRSFRRGWKQARRQQPPLGWVLTLFTLVVVGVVSFYPLADGKALLISLAALAELLVLFGVADLARLFMEKLVLAPPHERVED
jgi:hypothetical protein